MKSTIIIQMQGWEACFGAKVYSEDLQRFANGNRVVDVEAGLAIRFACFACIIIVYSWFVSYSGFCSDCEFQTLRGRPWQVVHEDASVLLLSIDGSAGLDLSFATHIFMLERIHDPALENQLVSRAHRMGATGPVAVQIVSVAS